MKKRMLTIMLIGMMLSLTACGGKNDTVKDDSLKSEIAEEIAEEKVEDDIVDATSLLKEVWDSYEDANKFAIMGGDYDTMVSDMPGKFDVNNTEALDSLLGYPADYASNIDDGASMIHAMNANTFTSGAFHLADGAQMETVAAAIKDNIMKRQWMCGFPDKLLIVAVSDSYLVSAFGEEANMDYFKQELLDEFDTAKILYEETIGE